MTRALIGLVLLLPSTAQAHRLDEYLQATILSIGPARLEGDIRLTPGIAVSSQIIGEIDANRDGVFSPLEQQDYAARVLRDLSAVLDESPLQLRIVSVRFPGPDAMREGVGEIGIAFAADTSAAGPRRRLVFRNNHRPSIATYLVNCTAPDHPSIQITAQNRSYDQSLYILEYTQPVSGYARAALGILAFVTLAAFGVRKPIWSKLKAMAKREKSNVPERYLGNRTKRMAAMENFIGIRKDLEGNQETADIVRELRRGSRLDSLPGR